MKRQIRNRRDKEYKESLKKEDNDSSLTDVDTDDFCVDDDVDEDPKNHSHMQRIHWKQRGMVPVHLLWALGSLCMH